MDFADQMREVERRYPSVDIKSPPGTKIVFHGRGGYPQQNLLANTALTVGETYTIAGSSIGNWETTFYLEGVDGGFNSVMFSPEGAIYE